MPQNNKRLPDPVIVVPGITATYLRDEYPVDHDYVWKVIKKDFLRIALHPDNLEYEAIEPARIVPGQVFEIAYKELIEELRYNLKEKEEEDIPVYPFGYDWRMPLETAELQLEAFIDEVIERTKLLRHYHANGYASDPKVNLVGHSMGGLVIAGYLGRKGNKARVNKVVTLATPFQGSFEAVLKIATGTGDLGTTPPSSRERETARVTPALYYLLPSFDGAIESDAGLPDSLFDPSAWQETVIDSIAEFIRLKGLPPVRDRKRKARKLFEMLLKRAEDHRKRIDSLKLDQIGFNAKRWMAVVGVDCKTRVKLKIRKNEWGVNFELLSADRLNEWDAERDDLKSLTGDGTVPFKGAIPKFLKIENLICVTPDDYGYWELQDKTLSKVAGFHGILPNMNMLHRLIVRFLKDLEDERGNTWGRRAPGAEDWEAPLKLYEKK